MMRETPVGSVGDSAPLSSSQQTMNKKSQQRKIILAVLVIVVIVVAVLFEVYKSDIENAFRPLARWLTAREDWSWILPVSILIILSLPPLFGHEIVQLVVGLAYPLGVAVGIAVAGSILGELVCFLVFRTFFTSYVDRKIESKVKWAAIARVAQEAGFRGVLIIRYSVIPAHLSNPLFACTGMKFWLYMSTVILSLPKAIVFVALGSPSSKNSKAAKVIKVIAIGVLVVVTFFAQRWIQRKLKVVTADINRERGLDPEGSDPNKDEMHREEEGAVLLQPSTAQPRNEETVHYNPKVAEVP